MVEAEQGTDGRTEHAERRRRFKAAIRIVAAELGHAPLSTEYLASYKEHKARGETDLPSLSAVVKHFGSWPRGLYLSGFSDVILPSRMERRRAFRPKRIGKYPRERLIECLRACARELGRAPTFRDYQVWRDEAVKRARGSGYPNDIRTRRHSRTASGAGQTRSRRPGSLPGSRTKRPIGTSRRSAPKWPSMKRPPFRPGRSMVACMSLKPGSKAPQKLRSKIVLAIVVLLKQATDNELLIVRKLLLAISRSATSPPRAARRSTRRPRGTGA